MGYTPRQVVAFLFLARRREKREAALQLHIGTLGARGDTKQLKRAHKELEDS